MGSGSIIAICVGVALLLATAGLFWYRRSVIADAARMRAVETSRAADIATKPAGSLVEVKGILHCDRPLTSELSQTPCAHAVVTVTREYIQRQSRSGGGSSSSRHSEIVSTNTVCELFAVEDESGRVAVDPSQGATIEGRESVNRFEPNRGDQSVMGVIKTIATGDETLGYRHVETILPLGAPVYVMGVVRADGMIAATDPDASDQAFIISVKSEEERAAALANQSRWLLWGAIACAAVALICFVIAGMVAN